MKKVAVGLAALGTLLAAGGVLAEHAPRQGRRIEVSVVSKGFVPDHIEVRKGEPITLVITRKTDTTCATAVVIKDFGIRKELPLNTPVEIALTPPKNGSFRYACGMDMVSGVLAVD